MSIHTILSQMEEEFDKKFVIRTGTKKIKRVGYYCTKDSDSHVGHDPKLILDFMRSFATRIVEEAKREERGRAEKAEKLLDDVCIIYQKHEDDLNIMDEVRDLMRLRISEGKDVSAAWRYVLDSRTKLQKMKI